MIQLLEQSLKIIAKHTKCGRRILSGIRKGKCDMQFEFRGLESGNSRMFDTYKASFSNRAPETLRHILDDKQFQSTLTRYLKKNRILDELPQELSQEEIVMFMLQKGGVGPSKFAQIISSDAEMMSKFSPEIQAVIKKTQSENPFSRNLTEAQDIVNRAFAPKQKLIGRMEEGALAKPELELIKPLSAGTVGEAYLARTAQGEEVIVKMIKKGIDAEQLELEEQIYTRLIYELAPNEATAQTQIKMLRNLYKDWGKELDFTKEFSYNKQLAIGAQRYKVADITRISEDGSCIIMEKAQGIQMNNLMKMLQKYKENPNEYFTTYAKELEAHPWLKEPDKIIQELPSSITKAFDEQFMFMKKGGTSIMHGDPHMGNYFITRENGVLTPIFIDTGNCVLRNKEQIIDDIAFLTNYFVGNSKGLAKYFVKQCQSHDGVINGQKLLTSGTQSKNSLIENIAADIQKLVFSQNANITDVDKITKTMQAILEKHGLNMNPESATALKAQMQFYTGINEAASLSGRTIDVGTIIKDMPNALWSMIKNRQNPIPAVRSAIEYGYKNQEQAANCVYQFLGPKNDLRIQMSFSTPNIEEVKALEVFSERSLAIV